jgi:hypothetical protein
VGGDEVKEKGDEVKEKVKEKGDEVREKGGRKARSVIIIVFHLSSWLDWELWTIACCWEFTVFPLTLNTVRTIFFIFVLFFFFFLIILFCYIRIPNRAWVSCLIAAC